MITSFAGLVLSAFLINGFNDGTYSMLIFCLLLLFSALFCAALYSIIKVKNFNQEFFTKTKNITYTCFISLPVSLIIAVFLPYLLFRNYFFNIYIVQYLYELPVLITFLVLSFITYGLISEYTLNIKKIVYHSITIATIVSVLTTVCIIGLINYRNQETIRGYSNRHSNLIDIAQRYKIEQTNYNITILSEIKNYKEGYVKELEQNNIQTQKDFSSKNLLCFEAGECFKTQIDEIKEATDTGLTLGSIGNCLKIANDELTFLNSSEFQRNFTSKEAYLSYLKNSFNSKKLRIQTNNKELAAIKDLAKMDFSYADIEALNNKMSVEKSAFTENIIPDKLLNIESYDGISMDYTLKHTTVYREIIRVFLNVWISKEENANFEDNKLIQKLYANKDIEEPIDSKIIRYEILLNYAG